MSRPSQIISIYTCSSLRDERQFWGRFREILKAHKLQFGSISIDDEFWHDLPQEISEEERERLLEENFKRTVEIFAIGDLNWPDLNLYGPHVLIIRPQPYGSPWGYEIYMPLEDYQFYNQGIRFCEAIISLCKDIFTRIPCDFGFGCHEDLYERQLNLLRVHKSLQFIPTLSNRVMQSIEFYLKIIIPKSPESAEKIRNHALANSWSLSYKPVWFYLLSAERYEASKPYLPKLPVEAIEKFPRLKGYGVERIEELENGGAFIFLGYPYDLESPDE